MHCPAETRGGCVARARRVERPGGGYRSRSAGEDGVAREDESFTAATDGTVAQRAAAAAVGGGGGAVDRLREYRESDAGAGNRTKARVCDSCGDRSEHRPSAAADVDREPGGRGDRRRIGNRDRVWGAASYLGQRSCGCGVVE